MMPKQKSATMPSVSHVLFDFPEACQTQSGRRVTSMIV